MTDLRFRDIASLAVGRIRIIRNKNECSSDLNYPRNLPSLVLSALCIPCVIPTTSHAQNIKTTDGTRLTSPSRMTLRKNIDSHSLPGYYLYSNGTSGCGLNIWPNGTYQLLRYEDYYIKSDVTNERRKSYGTWSILSNGTVMITPTDQKRKFRYLTQSMIFYPVRWGPRLYLIGVNDLLLFQDAIRKGIEPRDRTGCDTFFLRYGDENKITSGSPEFPPHWRLLIKKKNN